MDKLRQGNLFVAITLGLMCGLAAFASPGARPQPQAAAETKGQAAGNGQAMAAASRRVANVKAGTKISAQLESSLDARTAKPGDRVVARVTKNVKQRGRVVIHKGDLLMGHVTRVRSGATARAGSSIAVAFNQLQQAGSTEQLNAVVKSVFSAQGEGNFGSEPSPMSAPAPMAAPAGGGGLGGVAGGIVGGVGSTVGPTLGGAASTAGGIGSTVGGATSATLGGNASAGMATPAGAIHLGAEGQGQSATGVSSVLSTRHGDLRLNSGTEMQFQARGQAQRHHRPDERPRHSMR